MKKTKAMLLKYQPDVDDSGHMSKNLVEIGEIKGYFLPYGSELASNSDGYSENNAWNFYFRGNHPQLRTGNGVRYLERDYVIVNVTDMGRIKIVKLNSVVGTRSSRSVVQMLNY
jgi:hypothetical protein